MARKPKNPGGKGHDDPDAQVREHEEQKARNAAFDRAEPVEVEPRHPRPEVSARAAGLHLRCRGGMGEIWNAVDGNLRRRMLKKTLRSEFRDEEEMRSRLIEEAQITAQLDHPNIVPVHELGVDDDGNIFFTMKRVQGRTLADLLWESDPAGRTEKEMHRLLRIFISVCDAVSFAHSRGVINRDLKPDNVMVGDFGEVYVLDWGIARLLKSARSSSRGSEMPRLGTRRYDRTEEDGTIIGTPGYLAPEQATGDTRSQDERTDVFGLGGILYEMLTGKPPYVGGQTEVLVMAAECRITNPTMATGRPLPPRLCAIAAKALQKQPANRYQTVVELRDDVEAFLESGWQLPRRTFAPGALIVREGEPGDEAYIITEGRCRAFRTERGKMCVLREMAVGDVFGEIAVFTGGRRTASVE
ncbi:MAG TPA: protein kinase, partial [Polyangia bacterium]|nr:protein kinase [Polyangia bacterium]